MSPEVATEHTEPRVVRFWGHEYTVTPELLSETVKLGDGGAPMLLGVQPLNTRPNYYLVRLDAPEGTDIAADDFDTDTILVALEEQYGRSDEQGEWPAVNLDSGFLWFVVDEKELYRD